MSDIHAAASDNPGLALKAQGLSKLADGEVSVAYDLLQRAALSAPHDAEVAFHLGNLALQQGDAAQAVAHYRRAQAAAPQVTAVYNNLAAALLQLGEGSAAGEAVEAGLAIDPDDPALLNTSGNAAAAAGNREQALAHYERALAGDPGLHNAAVNRANALRDLQRYDEAEAAYQTLLAARPDDVEVLCGLALLLQDRRQHDAAIAGFRHVLSIAPEHRAALNNLAISYLALGDRQQALSIYRGLVRLDPTLPEAHGNLGQVLQGLGRHDEAVVALQRALALKPAYDAVLPYLAQSLMYQCAWPTLPELMAQVLKTASARLAAGEPSSLPPFAIAGSDATPALRLAVAKAYATMCRENVAPIADRLCFSYRRDQRRKLRVGYISPDFRNHSVGLSLRDIIAAHDHDSFTWFGYSAAREAADCATHHYRALFDTFIELPGNDIAAAATRINQDGIDVLVDLAGHTRDSPLEILALRPAPVQIHYFGYANTLGADWIQYLITDPTHTPPDLAVHCSETLIYLPGSFMATGQAPLPDRIPDRREVGLPETGFVFANFNGHYKFDRDTFGLWMQLLHRVDDSVLWLKSGSDTAMANLRRFAADQGVEPARLIFAERRGHDDHLSRHRLADLALDCLQHTGGVTTLDALWAGVPVLTVAGGTQAARTGASILSAIGLAELALPTVVDYRQTALALAGDAERLATLKARLWQNRSISTLFDPAAMAGQLQHAYRQAWHQWADGSPRETIVIPASSLTAQSCHQGDFSPAQKA